MRRTFHRHYERFEQAALSQEYFYSHSESHRRRPSIVLFPQFVLHTATFYDAAEDSGEAFDRWLQQFAAVSDGKFEWRRRDFTGAGGQAFTTGFLTSFAQIAFRHPISSRSRKKLHSLEDVEFFFEATHERAPSIVLRVEAHREYFSITIFSPIEDLGKGLQRIYEDNNAHLFPTSVSAEPSDSPFQCLFRTVQQTFPNGTFANFRAVICDPTCFKPSEPDASLSFQREGIDKKYDAQRTAHFLRSHRNELKESVFASRDEDVIACYLQRGQSIYLSALGSQRDNESLDELRYLVLYEKLAPDCDGARSQRFRLSRLVFRLNTIGTVRLAAMRELKDLRGVGDSLREIELRLEEAAYVEPYSKRDRKLMGVIRDLEKLADRHSTNCSPLLFRTGRAGYYFRQVTRLLDDLDMGQIPHWQTYRQFLHRRLFSTLEYVSGLGERVTGVWEIARSRLELVESRALLWLQNAASWASSIILPLAFADYTYDKLSVPMLVRGLYRAAVFSGWKWATDRLGSILDKEISVISLYWILVVVSLIFWAVILLTISLTLSWIQPAAPKRKRRFS